jgi:hypothetical protein
VHNDPRSPATIADLRAQHELLAKIDAGLRASWDGYQQVTALRAAVKTAVPPSEAPEVAAAVATFDAKLDSVAGNPNGRGFFRRGREAAPTFVGVSGELVNQLNAQDNGDLAPTPAMLAAYTKACIDLKSVVTAWRGLATRDLAALNTVLARNGIHEVAPPTSTSTPPTC